jgi:hypothetical protein
LVVSLAAFWCLLSACLAVLASISTYLPST